MEFYEFQAPSTPRVPVTVIARSRQAGGTPAQARQVVPSGVHQWTGPLGWHCAGLAQRAPHLPDGRCCGARQLLTSDAEVAMRLVPGEGQIRKDLAAVSH